MRGKIKLSSGILLGGILISFAVFSFLGNGSSEAAFDSRFLEKVGDGFIAPACGESTPPNHSMSCNGSSPSLTFNWANLSGDDDEDSHEPQCVTAKLEVNGVIIQPSLSCDGNYTWAGALSNTTYDYAVRFYDVDYWVTCSGAQENCEEEYEGGDTFTAPGVGHVITSGTFNTPNCSTGTIQGYKVKMPGNNQSATPPSGEIVTLDTPGSPVTYLASAGFSSTQGQNNWYYRDTAGNSLTYDSPTGWWRGSDPFAIVFPNGEHPGSSVGAVRRWIAPGNGAVRITGNARDGDSGGGDGVGVWIYKGTTLLWSQTIANGNTTGFNYDINTVVATGENIEFHVTPLANNANDSTVFDPQIVFTTGDQKNTNPYSFTGVSGNHNVSVSIPSGWNVGYTLCYNSTSCHGNTPTNGSAVTVNVPASGYADLWWHYTEPPPPPPPAAPSDYQLTLNPYSMIANVSGTNAVVATPPSIITGTSFNGYYGNITFGASAPSIPGATHEFIPASINIPANGNATSQYKITIPGNTTPGIYTITVTGSGGGLAGHTASPTITLSVQVRDPIFREVFAPMLNKLALILGMEAWASK